MFARGPPRASRDSLKARNEYLREVENHALTNGESNIFQLEAVRKTLREGRIMPVAPVSARISILDELHRHEMAHSDPWSAAPDKRAAGQSLFLIRSWLEEADWQPFAPP